MLKMISDKLGIQLIIISHIPEITDCADKVFRIENNKGEVKINAV